jgi:hypothetical protein
VDSSNLSLCGNTAAPLALREDTGSVGEGISDRGPELPEDLAQYLLELGIDEDVLVDAEVGVG